MGFLKKDRDYLITDIINEINVVILNNIDRQKYLSNLKNISKLDFLEDINEILESQYEIYKDDILVDLLKTIDDTLETFRACSDDNKNVQCQLDLIEDLQNSLFNSIEDSFSYKNLLEYVSQEGKFFRDSLPNFKYEFNEEMNKISNMWKYNIGKHKNPTYTKYNKSKDLLILK